MTNTCCPNWGVQPVSLQPCYQKDKNSGWLVHNGVLIAYVCLGCRKVFVPKEHNPNLPIPENYA